MNPLNFMRRLGANSMPLRCRYCFSHNCQTKTETTAFSRLTAKRHLTIIVHQTASVFGRLDKNLSHVSGGFPQLSSSRRP